MAAPRMSLRTGRRAGLIVFAIIVTAFTVVCSVQIIVQIWAPQMHQEVPACRPGIEALLAAVRRARDAAAQTTGDEREAMARFREALEPEWSWRASMGRQCASDKVAVQALRDVDRFRYAEEHAVRYAASNLSHLRQRMETLDNRLQQPK